MKGKYHAHLKYLDMFVKKMKFIIRIKRKITFQLCKKSKNLAHERISKTDMGSDPWAKIKTL